MGVEMKVYLLPQDGSFRPNPAELARFVEALRREHWVSDPRQPWFRQLTFDQKRNDRFAASTGAYVARMSPPLSADAREPLPLAFEDAEALFDRVQNEDRRVRWPIERVGETPLRYPFNAPSPFKNLADTYYDVELWLARDFVQIMSETIEPMDDDCSCGASLANDPEDGDDALFYAPRVRRSCERCSATFDPSARTVIWRHPMTNEARRIPAVAFRFGVVLDCGKGWPDVPELGAHGELQNLCESFFARPFRSVLDLY